MCSIMAAARKDISLDNFILHFNKTISRGPDQQKVIEKDGWYLGFNRLSIMGLSPSGMQPFVLDGSAVVCNGEIYGFEKIKKTLEEKGYSFSSSSDCEVLLPLWKEKRERMFPLLDAEFALVLYDAETKSLVAARDPVGIRPLYYGYTPSSTICFASEPKNLLGIVDKILPFPPGYYYMDGKFTPYSEIWKTEKYSPDNEEEAEKKIKKLLIKGVEKRLVSDSKIGFLLSGGLDSSLVCAIAQKCSSSPIKTFAIGMEGDAIDLKYAKETADYLKSDHTEVIMTKDEVLSSLDDVIYLLGTYDITTIRASMGMYLVSKYIHENTDLRVILTGEISDELFGYKYTDFAPSASEFQLEAEKRIREIHMYDVLRADRCISVNSLEARVPFGDLEFVKYVMSINPALKMNTHNKGKYLLRKAFEGDYLPHDILYREKAAFSDAVGHSMVDYLKEKAEKMYSDEEFEEKRKKYTHAQPFTKESLMYREIFEKYYPGQSQMVVDFWMPNKKWKGCDVNDPSARVLSNYGSSGV